MEGGEEPTEEKPDVAEEAEKVEEENVEVNPPAPAIVLEDAPTITPKKGKKGKKGKRKSETSEEGAGGDEVATPKKTKGKKAKAASIVNEEGISEEPEKKIKGKKGKKKTSVGSAEIDKIDDDEAPKKKAKGKKGKKGKTKFSVSSAETEKIDDEVPEKKEKMKPSVDEADKIDDEAPEKKTKEKKGKTKSSSSLAETDDEAPEKKLKEKKQKKKVSLSEKSNENIKPKPKKNKEKASKKGKKKEKQKDDIETKPSTMSNKNESVVKTGLSFAGLSKVSISRQSTHKPVHKSVDSHHSRSSEYSEYSSSSSSSDEGDQQPIVQEKPSVKHKPSKKDKKKAKKGLFKEEKDELPLEPIVSEVLVKTEGLEEARTSIIEGEEVIVEEKPKKKKKPKVKKQKKLPPKEQARLDEEKRLAAEAEALRLAEEERLRLIEERKMAIAKDKRDVVEQSIRQEQLEVTAQLHNEMHNALWIINKADKDAEEWKDYLICDGLPKPGNVGQMNTYLHLWEKKIEKVTVDEAVQRTDEVCVLMDKLQILIDDPFDEPQSKQNDWKWIHTLFREHQYEQLEALTYRLLGDIDNRMRRIDIPTSEFRLKKTNFSLCLWLLVQLPIPSYNPRTPPRPRVKQEWEEMNMEVVFPTSLKCNFLALRCMYVKYDHLSDSCANYPEPSLPAVYAKDLATFAAEEHYIKMKYKYDHRVKTERKVEEVVQEDGTILLVEEEPEPELEPGEMPPSVPYQSLDPSASDYALNISNAEMDQAFKEMLIIVEDKELNLRKYCVLGGVYYLNLYYQPTQPQGMVSFEIFITNLQQPCCLQEAPFYVVYTPPPPPEPGVRKEPEEIEEELIKQERELDELIFITLNLPTHVFWMDIPIACHWDTQKKIWTTKDIHDFKHIEEKGFITFRTGKFGPFALATLRYPNLPYQAWEVRPDKDGSVTLQLTAAIVMIEFHVVRHKICISQLQNITNNVLEAHMNVYYKLPQLKRLMKDVGLDLFPSFDTYHYVEGTCVKHWAMERMTYYGMAVASVLFNMTWSRWNMPADFRTIVLQMRQYRFDKPKQFNFSTVLVTPIKAVIIDCTEVSPQFSDVPIEGMKFYADFFQLVKGHSNMMTKTKLLEAPMETAKTLASLYTSTRFLSFS